MLDNRETVCCAGGKLTAFCEGCRLKRVVTRKPTNPKDAVGVAKVPMSVVPAPVMMEVALAMMEGALKYGRHNYREAGVRASIYYDAAMRHLTAKWEGRAVDPDSRLDDITKAIACLVVWRDAEMRGMLTDDRPPASADGWLDALNGVAADLLTRYPDPIPPVTNASFTANRKANAE